MNEQITTAHVNGINKTDSTPISGAPGYFLKSEDPSIAYLTDAQLRAFLLTLRDKLGSNTKLAERLGVTPQFISGLLNGKKHPGSKVLERLSMVESWGTFYVVRLGTLGGDGKEEGGNRE